MSLTEFTATSRVTVFPLECLTVAYTTQSSDSRCLGDVALVTVVEDSGDGDELWHLARDLGARNSPGDQARWILTQANRARIVAAYKELPGVTWTAHVHRRFVLDALFANHEVLMTGRIALSGLCAKFGAGRGGGTVERPAAADVEVASGSWVREGLRA
ncbi:MULTISPECIES: hypothetical protein [unclassified Streptomyces]|uniref:hypothetical protein n=1 Tax=unclassified Streptomyces TaxID=2593676 RepID=UPI001F4F4DB7|nr:MULTISPECIES: hypothetical protein [unclassified Streptomyces]